MGRMSRRYRRVWCLVSGGLVVVDGLVLGLQVEDCEVWRDGRVGK
jgi:hypothetical protein